MKTLQFRQEALTQATCQRVSLEWMMNHIRVPYPEDSWRHTRSNPKIKPVLRLTQVIPHNVLLIHVISTVFL